MQREVTWNNVLFPFIISAYLFGIRSDRVRFTLIREYGFNYDTERHYVYLERGTNRSYPYK